MCVCVERVLMNRNASIFYASTRLKPYRLSLFSCTARRSFGFTVKPLSRILNTFSDLARVRTRQVREVARPGARADTALAFTLMQL